MVNIEDLAIAPLVPAWVREAPAGSVSMTWLRVSSASKEDAAANADAAKVLSHRASVRRLHAMGGARLLLDASDREARSRLGVLPVLRLHASEFAEAPRREIGLLWPVEQSREILLMIHDSMAASNVYRPGDLVAHNAVTELLMQWLVIPAVGELHVSRFDRLTRSTEHGVRLQGVIRAEGVAVFEGSARLDLASEGGSLMTVVRTGMASSERDKAVTRQAVGQMAAVADGRWPLPAYSLCPGYRVDPDRRKRNEVVADEEFADAWTEAFRAAAGNASWREVGDVLAAQGVPARFVRYDRPTATFAEIPEHWRHRAAAQAISLGNVRLLRSRVYSRTWVVPVVVEPGTTDWQGFAVDEVRQGRPVVTVSCVWPEHGIDLSDGEWAALEDRLVRRASRERKGDLLRHVLTPGPEGVWVAGGAEFKVFTVSQPGGWGYYKVRRREVPASPRGWLQGEGEPVLSVRRRDADRAMGRALGEALEGLAASGELAADRVVARQRQDSLTVQRVTGLRVELREAEADLEDAQLVCQADATPRREARLVEVSRRVDALRREVDVLSRRLDAAGVGPAGVEVNVASLAGLSGLLQGSSGAVMPRIVNLTVRDALQNSLRLEVDDDPWWVVMSAVWHWPSVSGDVVRIPVRVRVRNRAMHDLRENRGAIVVSAVLRDGVPLSEALTFASTRRDAEGINDVAGRWMRQHGIGRPSDRLSASQRNNAERLARAALDCPIEVTRQIVWGLLSGEERDYDAAPEFVDHVRRVYAGEGVRRKGRWWAGVVRKERLLLRLLEDAQARGLDVGMGATRVDLVRLADLDVDDVTRAALGYSGSARNALQPVLERHPLNRRVFRPRQCPTCGEFMFHVLDTAEAHGPVCRSCRRTPGGPLLPEEYMLLWDAEPSDGAGQTDPFVGTRLASATEYRVMRVGLQPRLVGLSEAAALAGVDRTAVHLWANAGRVQVFRHPSTGKRQFDPTEMSELNNPEVMHVLPRRAPDGERLYLLSDVERETGVPASRIRRLALSTLPEEGPLPYEVVKDDPQRLRWLAFRRASVDGLDPEWIREMTQRSE